MPAPSIRVCVLGDSFVAGVGDETALGWAGRVAAAGAGRGLDLTVYPLGVRGDTSVQVAARLPGEVAPRLAGASEPRIVLSFGVNDTVLVGGRPRVAPAETLEALRRARRAAGDVPLLLVGPPAVDDDAQNGRIRALDAALATEAADLHVPYLPTFAATEGDPVWRTPVRAGDGFHPDAAGYARLAALLTDPLLAWLPPRPAGDGVEWFGAPGGEPVELHPASPRWAAEAAAWIDRIHGAVAPLEVRVEHIGSTAVPGLEAKPVVDLQVAVPRIHDEAAYRPGLESLGLMLRSRAPEHRFFRPPVGAPRTVHVHVCEAGSEWERAHLRFRDLLRADPHLAAGYAALKRRLAATVGADRGAYTEGKTAFIAAALARAESERR